tara:strand:+ start:170 stop:595 length:426 start_codon:yes stop_codon:yes gene_type:complete
MSKEDVNNLKKQIDEILGTKSSIREKIATKKDQERELFCEVLQNLQFVNSRTLSMKHDFKVNMMDYDDPFYVAIENLFKLNYTQEQRNLVNWWLYEKFLPSGDILVLTDTTTEKIIPSDTPEDIWDLVMEIKKKNEKKNTK